MRLSLTDAEAIIQVRLSLLEGKRCRPSNPQGRSGVDVRLADVVVA